KALPEFRTAQAEELLPVLRLWWERALPTIRTKAWEATWMDFRRQWELVRSPGEGAVLAGVGPWVAARTYDPLLRLEMAAEWIAARPCNQPFFLACRTAGDLIGVSKNTAARLLKHLVDVGILTVEEPADLKGRMATVYAYRGPSILTITNDTEGE